MSLPPMKRIRFLLLLAFAGSSLLGCASTPTEEPSPPPTDAVIQPASDELPPEERTVETACTAWALDITNHTRHELQLYVFRGDTAVAPTRRNRGHLIRFVGPRGRGSTLLYGARPAVMVYAFQEAANAHVQAVVDSAGNIRYEEVAPDRPERTWLLEVASPDRERWAWQARRVGLKFTCASS